jgi:hypothetical protein
MPTIRVPKDRRPLTLDDLRRNPGLLIGPSDLVRLGLFRSYDPIKQAYRSGKLAVPYRLPNGRPLWEGRDILKLLGASVEIPVERVNSAAKVENTAATAA